MTDWLLLIHQLPVKPEYLRVKVARRLQRIGAIALKNSVYVLPSSDLTLEDMQWTVRDIKESGGDATLCNARFLAGVTDGELQQRFNDARNEDYAPLLHEARKRGANLEAIRERFGAIKVIDFFGAANGQALEAIMNRKPGAKTQPKLSLRKRTWITRAGIQVDRMASAWLIRRFIDPDAKFRFVSGAHEPRKNDVRFDMFDAEFTHEGDRCTFEVLVRRAGLTDPAVQAIAEIVHDIDLHDDKFKRRETAGVAALVNGIAQAHDHDDVRLKRAIDAFDDLYTAIKS